MHCFVFVANGARFIRNLPILPKGEEVNPYLCKIDCVVSVTFLVPNFYTFEFQ
jgi:hypothetical protein